MNSFIATLNRLKKRRSLMYGLPFMVFMVGGSFILREFTALRYEYRIGKSVLDEAEAVGIEAKNRGKVTLESEFEKIKNLDIDNWENKRGPRPWEKPEVLPTNQK